MVAFYSVGDKNHARAAQLLEAIQRGEFGKVFATDLVVAETLNYLVAKARDHRVLERAAADLFGESDQAWLKMLHLEATSWAAARERFRRLARGGLSFTDCSSVAIVQEMALEGIVSFDRGFDGIITRIS